MNRYRALAVSACLMFLVAGVFSTVDGATRPRKRKAAAAKSAVVKPSDSIEIEYWASIKTSQNPKDFEAYLADYPKGHFRKLAENRLEQIRPTGQPFAATPPSKDDELVYWNSIKGSSDPEVFRTYLEKYPNGMLSAMAKSRLKKLNEASKSPTFRNPSSQSTPPAKMSTGPTGK